MLPGSLSSSIPANVSWGGGGVGGVWVVFILIP